MMDVQNNKIREYSLIGRIELDTMEAAFINVKKNRGAAGIDKQSIEMFEANLYPNLIALMKELKEGTYQPIALKRVYIPKGNGKFRPLGIPTVKCRIAQEVIRSIINSTFERGFHKSSHGFRHARSCHTAMKEMLGYHKQGYKFVVDADIKGFFDNISHELVLGLVEKEISDGKILKLIKKFLRSGVLEEGEIKPTRMGTPQGGVISPLLANIVLNHLDWNLDSQGYKFVRYADDFVVLCNSREQAERALSEVTRCIEVDLELQLSPEKTVITDFKQGFDFVGFHITSNSVTMRTKSNENFKKKVREVTRRSNNLEPKVIEKLNAIMRGYVNFFAQTYTKTLTIFSKLDTWIRTRIRCMKYKRKWATDNKRLRNKHISRMGLISMRELCLKLAY